MIPRSFDMMLSVSVTDEQSVLRAAARQLVAQKAVSSFIEGMAEINGDLTKAVTYLLDPGMSITGLEINDTRTTEH